MKLRNPFPYLRDLIAILPWDSKLEWEEVRTLRPDRPTVILVSGFGARKRTLSIIRKRLMRDGYNVLILAMDWQGLSDSLRGFYRMAEKLSTLVLALRKQKGMKGAPIYLVAHSAGGLVARYYVQQLGGWHYVEALITLATPHQGTWMAAFGFFSHLVLKARCLLHMLPFSPFIRELNAKDIPEDFRLVSVYSDGDVLCPPASTFLPLTWSARENVRTVHVPGLSHAEFLMSKETYRIVRAVIEPDRPTSTDDVLSAVDA